MTLRILIADDHVLFRQGLAALLKEQPGWQIVGEAGTGREAVELALSLAPQVVLLDVEMPEMDGVEAARQISAALPDTRILALSMYGNAHYRQRMRGAAALYYVRKNQPIDQLVAAINAAVAGERKPFSAAALSPREKTVSALMELNTLSEREREVLQRITQSQKMAEIAEAMGISPKTVETYRARLQEKLGINDLPGLVRFAIRAGLISPES